jgi:hypothetical protein
MSFEQERVMSENLSETPSVLRYSDILKVGTPLADLQYNTLIPSNGSTFSANSQIRIPFNVPTDSFVNLKGAYIKMRITNKNQAADAFGLDGEAGVGAFIDTWRIVSGTGALLEEIVHYNAIYALMNGLTGTDHRQSSMAITSGTSSSPYTYQSVGEANNGAVSSDRVAIDQNESYTATHIPMSGFFQCDRLAPLGFTNGTCYIEITLPNVNTPMVVNGNATSTAYNWEIDNVELHVPVLRMGSEFNASFRQLLSSGIPINWHSTSYHNVQSSIASAGGSLTLTVASRKRSVKSIITMFRKNADITSVVVDSVSCRKSLAITEWNYTLGGLRMPSKNVKMGGAGTRGDKVDGRDIGETYSTLVQCLSNLGNIYSASTFSPDTFYLPDNNTKGTNTKNVGSRVAYGLDLESYGHSDVQSGKNLANQGLPIVFECSLPSDGTNVANGSAVLADIFLLYDVVYTLDGLSGTITANA